MPKVLEEWTVLPHGKLTHLADDVMVVEGSIHMPVGEFPRRMTIVRLADGRLVIYSAIALDETEMAALEAFGRPAFLIVPCDIHRMDAKIWKARYPALIVVAPEGARKKVEDVVHVDAIEADFGDPRVQLVTVPGTGGHEAALLFRGPVDTTLEVNDLIANLDDRPGFGGWLLRLAGFAGGEPRIPNVIDFKIVKDRDALRDQLEAWARIDGLARIVVSHGAVVTNEPRRVLRELAATMDA